MSLNFIIAWKNLAQKQPLQEKLDIDSEESDLHALIIICDTDKDNDDFCVGYGNTNFHNNIYSEKFYC
jgi:hypothetical protein